MATAPLHSDQPAAVSATRRPVVVGLDGSQAALHALDWAVQEAAMRGCGLKLVYAHPADQYARAVLDTPPREHADEIFNAALDQLAARGGPNLDVVTVLRRGAAPRALLRDARGSQMLVVGRQGRSRAGEIVMGSTSLACATHARTPLTVVPDVWDADKRPTGCVLLGIDGSRRCDAAVEYAFGIAATRGRRIIAVHAIELPYAYPLAQPLRGDVPRFEESAARVFAASLDTWRNKYPEIDVTQTIEYGQPAKALAEYAAGADVAVIGGRGHGVVTGMLLGSVARTVLRRMTIPVTVIHDTGHRR